MAIAAFPTSPIPLIWYQQQPQVFQVDFTAYDDGGRDFKLQAGGNGIKSWFLLFDGLTAAAAALLDAHALLAKLSEDGLSANTFNYTDRDTTLYSGVRYLKYERAQHQRIWVQQRTIQLVKFP